MDGYAVEAALIRGLTKADVVQMIDRRRNVARLFLKTKELRRNRPRGDES